MRVEGPYQDQADGDGADAADHHAARVADVPAGPEQVAEEAHREGPAGPGQVETAGPADQVGAGWPSGRVRQHAQLVRHP